MLVYEEVIDDCGHSYPYQETLLTNGPSCSKCGNQLVEVDKNNCEQCGESIDWPVCLCGARIPFVAKYDTGAEYDYQWWWEKEYCSQCGSKLITWSEWANPRTHFLDDETKANMKPYTPVPW